MGVKEAVTYIENAISLYSDEVSSIENGQQAGTINTLFKVALTHLKEVTESVSKEAIATALCGASGSVGGDWRDKKMVRVEGSKDRIVDAIYALQLTAQQTIIPIPTVEEIADHIDLWFRTGEDKPWSFIVEDLAGSIHSLLTDRLKGGK